MCRIAINRLWRESDVGLVGWIGAELQDGTLVALCSVEKWELGSYDSLRDGWCNNERVFPRTKLVSLSGITEQELRADGLGSGMLRMKGLPSPA
jgi:hypothetical protein